MWPVPVDCCHSAACLRRGSKLSWRTYALHVFFFPEFSSVLAASVGGARYRQYSTPRIYMQQFRISCFDQLRLVAYCDANV